MVHKLTLKNFFENHITNPLTNSLSIPNRVVALALSILLALPTLFIPHLVSVYLRNRKIAQLNLQNPAENQKRFTEIQKTAQKVNRTYCTQFPESVGQLNRENFSTIVQKQFIEPCYSQPLPSRNDVTVPVGENHEERLWRELTREEKIEVFNAHTLKHQPKLSPKSSSLAVNLKFLGVFNSNYIPNDPRKGHGSDHGVRASIVAAVFVYLYDKYHPEYDVNQLDVLLAQLAAAGHDSARQTENIDVYDAWSAKKTVKVAEELGVVEEKQLEDLEKANADKDSEDFAEKPLIAKCTQNADSVEFARLLLDTPNQDERDFEQSRAFLDIYQEFSKKDESGAAMKLKDGFTLEEFQSELDAVRKEWNQLIYLTHNPRARTEFAKSDNYYEAILSLITEEQFPLLTDILTKIQVIKPKAN